LRISEIVKTLLYGENGYYMRHVKIGKRGDFFTAPHTSPLFGYTVASFLKREGVRLFVEVGGGEGYLMEDILNFSDLVGAIYEISPKLKEIQRGRLSKFKDRFLQIDDLIEADAYVLNEVIDALPFNRFIFKDGRWWEVIFENGKWELVEGEPKIRITPFEGFIYDETEGLEEFLEGILRKTDRVLIFDYGYDEEEFPIFAPEGTMSGYKEHRVYYGLDALREGADITHFPNFTRIKEFAESKGFYVKEYLPQSEFLLKYGILEIFSSLPDEEKVRLAGGLKTLLFLFKNHRVMYLEKTRL